jgi:hypothetical protein
MRLCTQMYSSRNYLDIEKNESSQGKIKHIIISVAFYTPKFVHFWSAKGAFLLHYFTSSGVNCLLQVYGRRVQT